MKQLILLFGFLLFYQGLQAQSQQGQYIRIMVSPSKPDMVYSTKEEITFDIAIYKFGQLIPNAAISYSYGPEMMKPVKVDSVTLVKGSTTLKVGEMDKPGFFRCHVTYTENGITYQNSGTAGVSPEQIKPTAELPDDFLEFWNKNLEDASRVPLEPVLTHMPEKSTYHSDVFHVSFRNITGHVYGILTKPKKAGKYPAILVVPGAGIRSYSERNTNLDVITLQIGIHGIPVNLYDSPILETQVMARTGFVTRMITADKDGGNLYVADPSGFSSHFVWRDPNHIFVWTKPIGKRAGFWLLEDQTEIMTLLGEEAMTANGHNTYVPNTNNTWVLNDTYPNKDREITLYLYHIPSKRQVVLGKFYSPEGYYGEWRCDLHPRCDQQGRRVFFDSTHEGMRQIYFIDIRAIVGT